METKKIKIPKGEYCESLFMRCQQLGDGRQAFCVLFQKYLVVDVDSVKCQQCLDKTPIEVVYEEGEK